MCRSRIRSHILAAFALAVLALGGPARAAGAPGDDAGGAKTLSPFFYVKGEDAAVDALPLKSTRATVRIAGVIADVTVEQVYTNEGQRPLEAVYIFPASTRAAVYGMSMTIGERVIQAKIREREQARREYEQAKSEGKSASLLEQQRPNVFQMNVANILPGDAGAGGAALHRAAGPDRRRLRVRLPDRGRAALLEPAGAAAPPRATSGCRTRTCTRARSRQATFDIDVGIAAGMPIRELTCRTHQVTVQYHGRDLPT